MSWLSNFFGGNDRQANIAAWYQQQEAERRRIEDEQRRQIEADQAAAAQAAAAQAPAAQAPVTQLERPAVAPPPTDDNPDVKAANDKALADIAEARRKGRRATFITGALGDKNFGSSVNRPTLLGR